LLSEDRDVEASNVEAADEQLVQKRDQLQKLVTEKNILLKQLIERLQELQFNINSMMSVTNSNYVVPKQG